MENYVIHYNQEKQHATNGISQNNPDIAKRPCAAEQDNRAQEHQINPGRVYQQRMYRAGRKGI